MFKVPGGLNFGIFFFQMNSAHHAQMDLNKKSRPMKKTIQTFKLDAQGFQKTMFENPPTQNFFWTSPPPGIEPGTFRSEV